MAPGSAGRGRTLVIAHRTCPRDAPENSLEGVRVAAAAGADYVELDVRCTRDGVPVLMHDPLLRRTTGRWWPVRAISSRRLRNVRLSGGAEPVPFLADVLAQLPDGMGLAIEVKASTAAAATLAEVERHGMRERVLLWSQRGRAVRWLARAAPGIEVALLRDTRRPAQEDRLLRDARAWGARAISIHQDAVRPDLLERARHAGLRTYTWLQDPATQRAKISAGLDGVVTDWIADARSLLTSGA